RGPHSGAGSPAATGHAADAPAPIPHRLGTTVLMWPACSGVCCGPVAIDNLSTGRLAQSQEPAISVGDYQPLLTQVGRWLVYVGDGVTAIRDDLSGNPRVLGPTPFFAPSAIPGHVWLFRARHGPQGPIQAWQVPVAGGAPSPPVTLPAGAHLLRGTDAGLLLQIPHGLALWNPGRKPRLLPYSPPGGISDGFDATARLVAYGTGCTSQATAPSASYEPNAGYYACTKLRIIDVVTGQLTSFAAPPGTAGWVPNGFNLVSAISPAGQTVAAYAALRPQGQGRVRLYLMRITSPSGQPRAVPSSAAYLFARTAWSANGTWLLYQGPAGHLWAYQVTSGAIRASSTPCCQYTVLAAVPSSSS
ncbi:MAG TPA: hypothetical protein VNH17_24035, partial [Streptosporangiaceae bacterium]|nr:hypothetical protein [Streptosporangiaceae bacterium]